MNTKVNYPKWMADPQRNYAYWSETEVAHLIESFDQGKTIRWMAFDHARTNGAIISRLTRMYLTDKWDPNSFKYHVHQLEHMLNRNKNRREFDESPPTT